MWCTSKAKKEWLRPCCDALSLTCVKANAYGGRHHAHYAIVWKERTWPLRGRRSYRELSLVC